MKGFCMMKRLFLSTALLISAATFCADPEVAQQPDTETRTFEDFVNSVNADVDGIAQKTKVVEVSFRSARSESMTDAEWYAVIQRLAQVLESYKKVEGSDTACNLVNEFVGVMNTTNNSMLNISFN